MSRTVSRPLPGGLTALALALALMACASTDETTAAADAHCYNRDPGLGSLVVRREGCTASTPESRDEARRQLEQMRQEQERLSGKKMKGS